jgi:hypothetical protein
MENYIFLDVDGVINIPPYELFDKDCLENLRYLIKQTTSKVIISSSWREGDLERTKKHFPYWLQKHIVGETIRGYKETIKGSSLPIERGNEIKHYIDRHFKYPWHAYPERDEEFKLYNEDGSFKMMRSNELYVDYNYVILDDNQDMLYEQKDNFVLCDSLKGFDNECLKKALAILRKAA